MLNTPNLLECEVFLDLQKNSKIDVVACLAMHSDRLNQLNQSFGVSESISGLDLMKIGIKETFEGVDPRRFTSDVYSALLWAEPIALEMMDRVYFLANTTYQERKYLFRYLVCYWSEVFERVSPDYFYTQCSTHEVFDFVAFAWAKHTHVKVITFNYTFLPGYQIPAEDYRHPWPLLVSSLSNWSNKEATPQDLDVRVAKYLEKLSGDHKQAAPAYFKAGLASQRNAGNGIKSILSGITLKSRSALKQFVFAVSLFSLVFCSRKHRKKVTHFIVSALLTRIKNEEFLELPRYYKSSSTSSDSSEPYVYFLLHFQPENSTSPLGGIFNDQILAISTLAAALPDGWKIRVKEHPGQFFKFGYYGYLSRDESFYKRILAIPNVRLVPQESNHFKLLDGAKCVAAITGTGAWEAVVRGGCAIVFGEAWFKDAPNVFRVQSVNDCRQAFLSMTNERMPARGKLYSFAKAVCEAGIQIDFSEVDARWNDRPFDLEGNKTIFKDFIEKQL